MAFLVWHIICLFQNYTFFFWYKCIVRISSLDDLSFGGTIQSTIVRNSLTVPSISQICRLLTMAVSVTFSFFAAYLVWSCQPWHPWTESVILFCLLLSDFVVGVNLIVNDQFSPECARSSDVIWSHIVLACQKWVMSSFNVGVAFSIFQSFLLCIFCLCFGFDFGMRVGMADRSLLCLGNILMQRDDFSSRAVVLNRSNGATC